MIGAAKPMHAQVGSRSMAPVAAPLSTTGRTNVGRRPQRSSRMLNLNAPTGRAAKPMPKITKKPRSAAVGFSLVKKIERMAIALQMTHL